MARKPDVTIADMSITFKFDETVTEYAFDLVPVIKHKGGTIDRVRFKHYSFSGELERLLERSTRSEVTMRGTSPDNRFWHLTSWPEEVVVDVVRRFDEAEAFQLGHTDHPYQIMVYRDLLDLWLREHLKA